MKNKLLVFTSLTGFFFLSELNLLQAADNGLQSAFFEDLFFKMFAGIAVITIIAAFYTFLRINAMLMQKTKAQMYKDMGLEAPIEDDVKESAWDRFMKKMTDVVPVEKEEDVMLNHNYDGIRELDNNLPPWWVAMFYISILFGIVYFTYYHIMKDGGKNMIEVYEEEMAAGEIQQSRYLERVANKVNERSVLALKDEADLESGKKIYTLNCVSCHGPMGEGGIGPNLTDDYWIHGEGDVKGIFKTVKYGVVEKGMTSWEKQIGPRQIQEVASYILTLRGTNPPNGKAPQGELVKAKEQ